MLSTLRLVLCNKEGSFSNRSQDTCTARSVGTRVNKDTTSKDTRVFVPLRHCNLMNCAKSCEILTWCADRPTTGFSRDARNCDSPYVGDDRNETTDLSEMSGNRSDPFQQVSLQRGSVNVNVFLLLEILYQIGDRKRSPIAVIQYCFPFTAMIMSDNCG